ncbi:hypothetical protein B0J13DRAFT_631038 [Dactylonectria estremocensis]|uniref:Uncharacterized protein n=1 Tax=Dactylonectria estremocensis TaxID=1079267 RepID=A0A9P9D5I6_9HYPO|nr:hypothetical protein B0J13DRAFT_631038 [Dactylonectria estremocensis]
MASLLERWSDFFGVDGAANAGPSVGTASDVINSLMMSEQGVGQDVEVGGTIDPEIQYEINKSQKEMKDVLTKLESGDPVADFGAQQLESKWVKDFKNACAEPKTFGSFVGVEIGKGTLFTTGIQLVQNNLIIQAQPATRGAGAADPRVTTVLAISKASKILQGTLDTWSKWQAAHYNERGSLGTIPVEDLHIQLFEILQFHILDLAEQRDKMMPLVSTAKQAKTIYVYFAIS